MYLPSFLKLQLHFNFYIYKKPHRTGLSVSLWLTAYTCKTLFLLETNKNNLPSLPTLATTTMKERKNHIFWIGSPESPSIFDTEITSFVFIMLIISLKLPAARITLKNISDSENLISLHQSCAFFAFVFQYHTFMLP